MPTTNEKIEKHSNNEDTLGDSSAPSFRQAITTIEHKIRNLEKQKAELESYRELQTTSVPKIGQANMSMYKPPGPGAGFMDSFLKFLQNERVTSPPAAARGGRRQSWKRSKTLHQTEVRSDSNNINESPTLSPISRLSQGDSRDDLPKDRKRNSFNSSDEDFSSDDNFVNKKVSPAINPEPPPKEKSTRRGRPPKTERKKARSNTSDQEWEEEEGNSHQIRQEKQEVTVPRRESSKRAAKEKCIIKRLMASDDETGETSDSDSDPAWTPQVKEDHEEDEIKSSLKKRKRGRPAGRRKTVQNSVTKTSEEPEIEGANSQPIEVIKKVEETTHSDSELAVTPQAKGDSEDDTVNQDVQLGKRGRPAGQKETVQNSVVTTSEQPDNEDSDSQLVENKKIDDVVDSNSESACTPPTKENSEDEEEKSYAKKRTRASRRKEHQNSDVVPKEQNVENIDDQPLETTEASDSEWTPGMRDDSGDEFVKKGKRRRPGRKKTVQNSITKASEDSADEDMDIQRIEKTKKQKSTDKKEILKLQTQENNARSQMVNRSLPANLPEDGLFKFVVIKSELKEEWPAIWRVDGKSLLQKYEPFEQNGQMLYRNISTFISWTPESKRQYVTVPVKYRSQCRLETVVEFLKKEMTVMDYEFLERTIKEYEVYQDSFEVYIQALISQALDSNFLKEIIQEQDDYFLSRVKTIDEITNSKKRKLLCILRWPPPILVAVSTWPCFNIIRELSVFDAENKFCAACLSTEVSVQVLMYGQPYNSTTLEGCQPDPHIISEKNFLICRLCANRVQLFNKITHQKYLLYIECAKRVAVKRTADPHKDTTCILNEFLADDNWLNQLFLEVRSTWGEVDSLYLQYQEPRTSVIPMS